MLGMPSSGEDVARRPVRTRTSRFSAGRGRAGLVGSLILCALLLALAGACAWAVPDAASYTRAWKAAVPCTAETPAAERGACLAMVPAVIAEADVNMPRKRSILYFDGGRPLERLAVSRDAAQEFRPGDRVELTLWRGTVMEVTGERHVWREHVATAGDLAVGAAVLTLAAGYPAAWVTQRLRGRRLADDEVLPSVLPFAGVLAVTALWLLPLCYLYPTTSLAPAATIAWATSGTLATLGLLALVWRETRVRTPGSAGESAPAREEEAGEDVFLAARFLEHTDYNPYGFGTHIVLGGDGPPAVTPHHGPGRFAAKPIPVERLTVKGVRRLRGGDDDTVPRSWHVAELDDAGTPVRLAAAPANLPRILRALGAPRATEPDLSR
jgi:hypothetical protein